MSYGSKALKLLGLVAAMALTSAAFGLSAHLYLILSNIGSRWLTLKVVMAVSAAGFPVGALGARFLSRRFFLLLVAGWAVMAVATIPLMANWERDQVRFIPFPAKTPELFGHAPAVSIELNSETRACVDLEAGDVMTALVTVPPHARLVFGAGVRKSDAPARGRLTVKGIEEPLRRQLDFSLAAASSHWEDFSLDLAEFAGRRALIEIEAEPDGPSILINNPWLIRNDPAKPRPNVLLIVIDTTRQDQVSGNPGHPGPTPNLAGLASQGAFFTRNYAQSSWTMPSMGSLFTSLMPIQAGVLTKYRLKLEPGKLTLAEAVHDGGWRTVGFSANKLVQPSNGFHQGFDSYTMVYSPFANCLDIADRVTNSAINWLERKGRDPFFMFLLYIDPHRPYLPPSEFRGRAPVPALSWIEMARAYHVWMPLSSWPLQNEPHPDLADSYRSLYQGEVQYTDHSIGRLLTRLKELGILEHTLVIVTADHGEEFLEHGQFFHGTSLYEEVIKVPMIIYDGADPIPGITINRISNNLDVFPTALHYLGIDPPQGILGKSLLPLVPGGDDDPGAVAYSELPSLAGSSSLWGKDREGFTDIYRRAIITERYKLIMRTNHVTGAVGWEGFDLAADPMERRPIPDSLPEMAGLRARLSEFFNTLPSKTDLRYVNRNDPELIKQLKAMGYIRR